MRKETYLKSIIFCASAVLFYSSYAKSETWTTVDYPGATKTIPYGINGNNIVGCYSDGSSNNHGFLYDGTNWTTLDYPGATSTSPYGISGNNIIGSYSSSDGYGHGFIYDGTNWTTILIIPRGIDGSNIVGGNQLYNITTQILTAINYPGATSTGLTGISGNNIVGSYQDSQYFPHSFLYDGSNWTTLSWSCPIPQGIDGSNVVGSFVLYNITTQSHTTLKYPGSALTQLYGISGNSIVGFYENGDPYGLPENFSAPHGFVYTIPEPCTLLLLGLGAAISRRKQK
ncbi:MAG: PEP-CTERM sorting domain-containing protein [Sedimentisphaerales bacterium]